VIVPLHRITHADDCYAHRGFGCTCNRSELYLVMQLMPWALAIALVALLALLAAVLK